MEIESSINEAISTAKFNDKVKGKVPKIRTDWLIWKLSSLPLLYHIILSFIDHGSARHNSLEENTYICIIWFKIDNLRSTIADLYEVRAQLSLSLAPLLPQTMGALPELRDLKWDWDWDRDFYRGRGASVQRDRDCTLFIRCENI